MYSPVAMPTPSRITLGPSTFRSGGASGRSRYGTGGRFLAGISGAYSRWGGGAVVVGTTAPSLARRVARRREEPNSGSGDQHVERTWAVDALDAVKLDVGGGR